MYTPVSTENDIQTIQTDGLISSEEFANRKMCNPLPLESLQVEAMPDQEQVHSGKWADSLVWAQAILW